MDPDNALYDAACDLVAAASRVDRAVRRDGVEAAIPRRWVAFTRRSWR
jgi:hypothetical protein